MLHPCRALFGALDLFLRDSNTLIESLGSGGGLGSKSDTPTEPSQIVKGLIRGLYTPVEPSEASDSLVRHCHPLDLKRALCETFTLPASPMKPQRDWSEARTLIEHFVASALLMRDFYTIIKPSEAVKGSARTQHPHQALRRSRGLDERLLHSHQAL